MKGSSSSYLCRARYHQRTPQCWARAWELGEGAAGTALQAACGPERDGLVPTVCAPDMDGLVHRSPLVIPSQTRVSGSEKASGWLQVTRLVRGQVCLSLEPLLAFLQNTKCSLPR